MFKTDNLYQNDPKWKSDKLGLQNKETIGSWGCLLTSMTMVLNGLGFSETPQTVNEKMKVKGGFQGALVYPYMLPQAFPGIVYKGHDPCENSPAPLAKIDATLAAGKPVIAQVDWNPQAGIQTHWIVLKEKKGKDYVMYDPYRYKGDSPEKELLLTQRYKHTGKDPAQAITGVVWFEGSGSSSSSGEPPKPKSRTEVPKDSMKVYGTADDLAFRADPNLGGHLIKRLPMLTEFKTLTGKKQAERQLGVMNEWLHVEGPDGNQGYIAAWYASSSKEVDEQEQPPKETPVTGDKGFVVKPTTDGLAFRTKMVVADNTLIKRLSLTATLRVLEPEATAKAKLGVEGQWLNVQDLSGKQGYVAAWYVTSASQPAVGVRPEPTNKPSDDDDIVLRTTAEGVALRSQPYVADNTLVKRLVNRAELLLLDDSEKSKIGQYNQWLNVKDIEEDEGYVAAWYAERR